MLTCSQAETAGRGAARQRKMEAYLARMSPEGRAMTAAYAKWAELLYELQGLRKAASGFINGSYKKAMTKWIEATFAVRYRRSCSVAMVPSILLLLPALSTVALCTAALCSTTRRGQHRSCTFQDVAPCVP